MQVATCVVHAEGLAWSFLYTLVFDDFTKHDIPFDVEIIFCSVNVKKRKEKRKYLIAVYQKTQKGYI